VEADHALLEWMDNSNDELEFVIEQMATGDRAFVPVVTVPADTVRARVDHLAANRTYYFRVYARNSRGRSDCTNEVSVLPQAGFVELWRQDFPEGGPAHVAMAADGRVVVGAYVQLPAGGAVFGFSPQGEPEWESAAKDGIRDVSISNNGQLVLVVRNDRVQLFEWGGNLRWSRPLPSTGFGDSGVISGDGRRVYVGTGGWGYDPQTRTYSGGMVLALSVEGDSLWSSPHMRAGVHVATSRDGNLLLTGPADGRVYLLDGAGRELWNVPVSGFGANASACSISADGSRLLVGSDDPQVLLFDGLGTRLWRRSRSFHPIPVAISPDGSILVTASNNQHLGVLDARGNEHASYLCEWFPRSIDVNDSGRIAVGLSGGGVRVLQVTGPGM
jgi:outer membrane protein assembly factor BamB